ncbi:phage tail-collar fiber domain-containing protein [Photobacterium damselae subsp. damselae]
MSKLKFDSNDYYAIVTTKGQDLINKAYNEGKVVNLVDMAIGDSNGSYVTPDPSFTALAHEFGRQPLEAGEVYDAAISAAITVKPDYAGNTVREFGLYDDAGNLIIYGSYPESLIIDNSGSSYMQLKITVNMYIVNASAVNIIVNPTIPYATEEEPGISEIATQDEVDKGDDRVRFVTPWTLKNCVWFRNIIDIINNLDLSGKGIKRISGNKTPSPHSGDDVTLDLESDFGGAKKNGDSANNFSVKDASSPQHAVSLKQLEEATTGASFTAFSSPIVVHPRANIPSGAITDIDVSGHGIPDGSAVFVNYTAYPDYEGTGGPNIVTYGLINHGDSSVMATRDNSNFAAAGEDSGSQTFASSGQVVVKVAGQKIRVSRTPAGGSNRCYFTAAISGWLK